jgi:hypothetical protein
MRRNGTSKICFQITARWVKYQEKMVLYPGALNKVDRIAFVRRDCLRAGILPKSRPERDMLLAVGAAFQP